GEREGRNGALDLAAIACAEWAYFHPVQWRHGLDGRELTCSRAVDSPEDHHARHSRRDLLEQLQPFCALAVFDIHETGSVTTGTRQALNIACTNWIGDIREYDRHSAGRL